MFFCLQESTHFIKSVYSPHPILYNLPYISSSLLSFLLQKGIPIFVWVRCSCYISIFTHHGMFHHLFLSNCPDLPWKESMGNRSPHWPLVPRALHRTGNKTNDYQVRVLRLTECKYCSSHLRLLATLASSFTLSFFIYTLWREYLTIGGLRIDEIIYAI